MERSQTSQSSESKQNTQPASGAGSPPASPTQLPPTAGAASTAARGSTTAGWTYDDNLKVFTWWDGHRYTSRAEWDGTSWSYVHLEPASIPTATVTGLNRRRRRKWPWLLVPTGLLAAVGLGYAFHEAVLTHDLLQADFESGAEPFRAGEWGDYSAEVTGGSYQITATHPAPDSPAWSFAWLARPAGAVFAEATIIDASDGRTGVACIGEGEASPAFSFVVGDGRADLVESPTGQSIQHAPASDLERGQRIGIQCGHGYVAGFVDGEVVISDNYSDTIRLFDRVALVFQPARQGDAASFDNVHAHLPETPPG